MFDLLRSRIRLGRVLLLVLMFVLRVLILLVRRIVGRHMFVLLVLGRQR